MSKACVRKVLTGCSQVVVEECACGTLMVSLGSCYVELEPQSLVHLSFALQKTIAILIERHRRMQQDLSLLLLGQAGAEM